MLKLNETAQWNMSLLWCAQGHFTRVDVCWHKGWTWVIRLKDNPLTTSLSSAFWFTVTAAAHIGWKHTPQHAVQGIRLFSDTFDSTVRMYLIRMIISGNWEQLLNRSYCRSVHIHIPGNLQDDHMVFLTPTGFSPFKSISSLFSLLVRFSFPGVKTLIAPKQVVWVNANKTLRVVNN